MLRRRGFRGGKEKRELLNNTAVIGWSTALSIDKMKQFIVMAAVLPLMMIILLQFGTEMKISDIKHDATEIVYEYAEQARGEGGFAAIKSSLGSALSVRMNVPVDSVLIKSYSDTFSEAEMETGEIFMNLDNGPLYKGYGTIPSEFVRYKIQIKVHDVVSGSGLLGISDPTILFKIEGKMLSEKLRP